MRLYLNANYKIWSNHYFNQSDLNRIEWMGEQAKELAIKALVMTHNRRKGWKARDRHL